MNPDRPAKKMAQSLGLGITRKLSESTTFQLSLFGHWLENDIPSLTITAGKPWTLDRSLCDSLFSSLQDLMTHLGVLTTTRTKKEVTQRTVFQANKERPVFSSHAGLFVADVKVGGFLKKGEMIGQMASIETGEVLEEYAAPEDGYLVTLRHYPLTFEKETIAILLTDKKQGFWPF